MKPPNQTLHWTAIPLRSIAARELTVRCACMKINVAIVILVVLIPALAYANEIQYFNPQIFGNLAGESTLLLSPAKDNSIKPTQIITDINEKGIFYAARLIYPKALSLEEARQSINKLYKQYEVKSFTENPAIGIWRNETGRFTIQLSSTDECDSKLVQIIYIWLDR